MNPADKSKLLVVRVEDILKTSPGGKRAARKAKYLTLLLIDEVQKALEKERFGSKYWTEVRKEIEKLVY